MAENWKYPRTKFVDINHFYSQLDHIKSEIEEIESTKDPAEFVEEMLDLKHSVETLVRMLYESGVNLKKRRAMVIAKNEARGYYVSEGSQKES